MAAVNFSIPDRIKKQFNQTFAHQNRSQIIARLMEQAIKEHRLQKQRERALEMIFNVRNIQKSIGKKRKITDAKI